MKKKYIPPRLMVADIECDNTFLIPASAPIDAQAADIIFGYDETPPGALWGSSGFEDVDFDDWGN